MDLLPQFFPQFLPDLLSQKGEIMGLDQISFNDFYLSPGADKLAIALSGEWTAAKLYMANASPSKLSVSTEPSTVIYAKGSAEYGANAQLDTNGDGQITMQDLINAVNYHRETPEYVAAKYRYRKTNNMVPFSNPSLPTGWPT